MDYPKELINKFDEYKKSGKEDVWVNKKIFTSHLIALVFHLLI